MEKTYWTTLKDETGKESEVKLIATDIHFDQKTGILTYQIGGKKYQLQGREKALSKVQNFFWQDQMIKVAVSGGGRSGGDLRLQAQRSVAWNGREVSLMRDEDKQSLAIVERRRAGGASHQQGNLCVSPMPGKILKVLVKNGDQVKAGADLLVVEAMKMEHSIKAMVAGTVEGLKVQVGEKVLANVPLVHIAASEGEAKS
jgi:biotin carboxyl carrier protein